jgi:hypothetical protein
MRKDLGLSLGMSQAGFSEGRIEVAVSVQKCPAISTWGGGRELVREGVELPYRFGAGLGRPCGYLWSWNGPSELS